VLSQGTLTRAGNTGTNGLFFTGRIGNRPLSPGSYRLTVTATADARVSAPRTLAFRVIPR
jgi:hypothetical protein